MKFRNQELLQLVVLTSIDENATYRRIRAGSFVELDRAASLSEVVAQSETAYSFGEVDFDLVLIDGLEVDRAVRRAKSVCTVFENSDTIIVTIGDYFQLMDIIFSVDKMAIRKLIHEIRESKLPCRRIIFGKPGKYTRFVVSLNFAEINEFNFVKAISYGPSVELPSFYPMLSSARTEVSTSNPPENVLAQRAETNEDTEITPTDITSIPFSANIEHLVPQVESSNRVKFFAMFDEKKSTSIVLANYISRTIASAYIVEVGLFRTVLKSQLRKNCSVDEIIDVNSATLTQIDFEEISGRIDSILASSDKTIVVVFGSELFEKVLHSSDRPLLEECWPLTDVNVFFSHGDEIQARALALKSIFGFNRRCSGNLVTSGISPHKEDIEPFNTCNQWRFEDQSYC